MPLFAVIGHASAFGCALPYAGPVATTKRGAVKAWRDFAIANKEIPSEVQNAADALEAAPLDTRVTLYGGDEVVVCWELKTAAT
jgi:hypothetical protein